MPAKIARARINSDDVGHVLASERQAGSGGRTARRTRRWIAYLPFVLAGRRIDCAQRAEVSLRAGGFLGCAAEEPFADLEVRLPSEVGGAGLPRVHEEEAQFG